MKIGLQTTLAERVVLTGAGVHSNAPVRLILHPADADSGIVFLRTGLPNGRERHIEARWSKVSMTELCTVIGDASHGDRRHHRTSDRRPCPASGSIIASSRSMDRKCRSWTGRPPLFRGGHRSGRRASTLKARRRFVKILKSVRVDMGRGFSELAPRRARLPPRSRDRFQHQALIGRQSTRVRCSNRHISVATSRGPARSASSSDVERLWKAGFALGSSLENSMALDGDRIHQSGRPALRRRIRPPQDARRRGRSGAGRPARFSAHYRSYCSGHKMNVAVLEALFCRRSAYEIDRDCACGADGRAPRADLMPGRLARPMRRT
jgi:UDP-3-O-[3-hydroxymyristoyl] N-acetylglucosamine deacetylase